MLAGAKWIYILALLVFCASASNEYISYFSGTIVGKFYSTLVNNDKTEFWKTFYKASFIYIGQTMILATAAFLSWMLSYAMRKNLVQKLHELYFNRKSFYYMIRGEHSEIDNPDQRLTQDIEKFTSAIGQQLIPSFLVAPGVIGYYTWRTWKTGGGIGVACIYGYFVVGFIVNRVLLTPITRWTRRQEKAEGDFRYKHMNIRDNNEEAAFYESENFENIESDKLLSKLIYTLRYYGVWKYPILWFQKFFDYYGGVLTYAIQYIPVFLLHSYKDDNPGELANHISNNAFVFMYLINSFTRLTDLAIIIGEIAAYAERIAELIVFCKKNPLPVVEHTESDGNNKDDKILYKMNNVNVYNSVLNHQESLKGVTADLKINETVLITGPSGSGKTSLLRVLKKLWAPQTGTITYCNEEDKILFLPQQCYLPTGGLSLLEQLLFPKHLSSFDVLPDIQEILNVLYELDLQKLISLCGELNDSVKFEWKDILSPGEQQRLSIARALISKPKVLIMDESTSSLSENMESIVYKLLQKNNINYISTGHRKTLFQYHSKELHFSENEGWTISEIQH